MRQTCGIDIGRLYNRVGDDRPRTAGQAHAAGMTLMREPKAPVRRRAGVRPDMDAILHDPTEENLLILCRMLLGNEEMERNGGLWRTKARTCPARMHEALLDLRLLAIEGRGPQNPAAWLNTALPAQKISRQEQDMNPKPASTPEAQRHSEAKTPTTSVPEEPAPSRSAEAKRRHD